MRRDRLKPPTAIGMQLLQHSRTAQYVRAIYLMILFVALFSSCNRDELCFQHEKGCRIRILVNYNEAQLAPDKSYIAIYNAYDGTLIREEVMQTPTQHNTFLPVGKYSFVVYNEPLDPDDYSTSHTVVFAGIERWSSFGVLAKEDPSVSKSSNNTAVRGVLNIEEELSASRVVEFEVTPAMVKYEHTEPVPETGIIPIAPTDTMLRLSPSRVFTHLNIELNVINYSGWTLRRTNGSRPRFFGASDSYLLASNSYSELPTEQFMIFFNNGTKTDVATLPTLFTANTRIMGTAAGTDPTVSKDHPYSLSLRFEYGSAAVGGVEIRPYTINLLGDDNADLKTLKMIYTAAGSVRAKNGKIYPNNILDIYLTLELPQRIPIGEDEEVDMEEWDDNDVSLDVPPTIHFNPNGADGAAFQWKYPINTLLFMPNPTHFTIPNGYRFKEWNTQADGQGKGYAPGDSLAMPTRGITLYAIWIKN